MKNFPPAESAPTPAQRGVSLIVVLISLLIMSFAAVALLRSTDTATMIAGNLTFKKTALASGDAGTEAGITWLTANLAGTTLHADQEADGYYSRSADACDLTGQRTPDDDTDDVNWAGGAANANCPLVAVTVAPAGAEAGYTITVRDQPHLQCGGRPRLGGGRRRRHAHGLLAPDQCRQLQQHARRRRVRQHAAQRHSRRLITG